MRLKSGLFILILMLFSSITFASEGHSIGPSLPFSSMSVSTLIIVCLGLLAGMIICTVLLEHSIEGVASKTGSAIGTVLLACATSLPLIVIAITSAINGHLDIALINIFGTNIANVTMVLGILALIKPLSIGQNHKIGISAIVLTLIVGTLIWVGVSFSAPYVTSTAEHSLTFNEGILILAAFVIFVIVIQAIGVGSDPHSRDESLGLSLTKSIVLGAAVCWFASQAVLGLIRLATIYNLPHVITGTVLVVVGTSFPEFAVGIVSIFGGKDEDVFGNLITSSMVNLALTIGVILMFTNILVEKIFLAYHIPVMIVSTILAVHFLHPRYENLTRTHGFVLLGVYGAYIVGISLNLAFF